MPPLDLGMDLLLIIWMPSKGRRVVLVLQRARAVDLVLLSTGQRCSRGQICCRLDGIPLAIELAAAAKEVQ